MIEEAELFRWLGTFAKRMGWELTRPEPGPEEDTVSDSWEYIPFTSDVAGPVGLAEWAKLAGIIPSDAKMGQQ